MEAPDQEELEWMLMQEQEEDECLFDESEILEALPAQDQVEQQFINEVSCESSGPVKRKRLELPEIPTNWAKVQKTQNAPSTIIDVDIDTFSETISRSEQSEPTTVKEQSTTPELQEEEVRRHNAFKRAADIIGDCISITGPTGERVYAEIRQCDTVLRKADVKLLSEPIEKIIERLERQRFEQACGTVLKATDNDVVVIEQREKLDQLWVDKYAPKSFTELLSNEQTNREVLSWLKQWDPCVFGTKRHSTSREVLAALAHKKQTAFKSSKNDQKAGIEGDNVLLDRPHQKVLLLCGPPGLGKTTLAHVAAKHCGYRVVEINASDDRAAASFQNKIVDAVQMKSVMGDSRPNCLVIDEIDGAFSAAEGKGAINFLLEIISAETKSQKENNDSKGAHKKKCSTGIRRLSRPVICICNDLYAPALRSLRQVARVHVFTPPRTARVVTRLKHICNVEGYKVNPRALTALAEHTESDIRSCLNTLQFLNRKREALKTMDVGSQIVGRKDMTSNMMDIWAQTFCNRKPKYRDPDGLFAKEGKQQQREFLRLHDLFSNHGDHDLAIEGVHENLLRLQYHDLSLQKTVQCLGLVGDSDIFAHKTFSKQQFHLAAYRPCMMMAVRRLVAQPLRPSIEWPKSYYRHKTALAFNKEIASSWLISISPTISRNLSCSCLVEDVLSSLIHILSPSLRPVASHLLSSKELNDLKELVDTMITYGISYKQHFTSSSSSSSAAFAFALHPPLHNLLNFKDYVHKRHQLSSTLQQLLAHEVEMEIIRRESAVRAAKSSAANTVTAVTTTVTAKKTGSASNREAKKSVKSTINFFEKFKIQSKTSAEASLKKQTVQRDARPILFKFNEGFTNAIRKAVLMRDFC